MLKQNIEDCPMHKINRKTFFRNSGAGLVGFGALNLGCGSENDFSDNRPANRMSQVSQGKDIDPCRGGWIAYSNWHVDAYPLLDYPIAFRKDIDLQIQPASGKIKISAADVYLLYCNGHLVGSGPARSWPREKYYDEIDLLPLLKQGKNHLAALLFPCTGVNFLMPFTRMGLFIQGDIKLKSGQMVQIDTDPSWECRTADWIRFNQSLISLPTGYQEHYDVEKEERDWKTKTPASGWSPALYLGSVGLPPWNRLVKKPIPDLLENELRPELVWQGMGSKKLIEDTIGLAEKFNRESLAGKKTKKAVNNWFKAGPGNVLAFDFGKTRFIRPGLEIKDVSGPIRLEMYYDIKFSDRPSAHSGFGGGFNDTIRLEKGGKVWQVHRGRGFRYLTVKITGSGSCSFRPLAKTLDYPFKESARLETGEPFVQTLWDISKENIRSSTNDAYVDTCSRENLLWTMDACATAKAAFYSFAESDMWRHCLKLVAMGIDQDGNPAAVVPTDCPSPLMGQTMHWVTSSYEYFLATGEKSLLEEIEEPLVRFLRLCKSGITAENLYIPPGYSWHWVDWASIDKRPYSLPINGLLLWASQYAVKIGSAVGSNRLKTLAGDMQKSLAKGISSFFSPGEKAFLSRIEPKLPLSLPPVKPNSVNPKGPLPEANIHGNILSIITGCGSPGERQQAMNHVVKLLNEPPGPDNDIGMGYADILLTPVLDAGHISQARKKLDQLYGYFIESGQPTWGERASEKHENTAHGWAASVNSLIVEGLIGLRPLSPGWKSFSFKPAGGFTADFQYSLSLPAGKIEVRQMKGRLSARWPKGARLEYQGQSLTGSGKMVELG
jgi:alpha-L-rhamnosidase